MNQKNKLRLLIKNLVHLAVRVKNGIINNKYN